MDDKKKQDILKMDEVSTYFLIDECGAFIFKMGHSLKNSMFEKWNEPAIKQDIINVQETQQFAVDNLGRYGIDPQSAKDKPNGDYWKWYRHWNKWKELLPVKDWQVISKLMSKGKSIKKYLPEKTWKDE